jgi:thiaminase/transcriptional activator TenA
MSLARELWEENADLAREALEHRFVRGLEDGSLPLKSFQEYVGQDAFFLEAFARAYALALARGPGGEDMREFAELLFGALQELGLHEGYAAEWGVRLEDVLPNEATLAYTDFLRATAALGSVGETCAAMAPCMRLYAFLGQELELKGSGEDNPYAGWIETYADPGFDELAEQLENLLDRHASDSAAVRSKYRRAMALEVAFFEANAETT